MTSSSTLELNSSNDDNARVVLRPHPSDASIRDQAICTRTSVAGTVLFSTPAFSSVLLHDEKGKRCDYCHSNVQALRRCSGCAAYYYCGQECQSRHWTANHRKMCKNYNQFVASVQYQALPAHERMDALLLSQLIPAMHPYTPPSDESTPRTEGDIFMSLLPGHPTSTPLPPPICYTASSSSTPSSSSFISTLHSRFGNNNFAIHSHLTTYAHGIFPLSSRLFNHSCSPNAAPRYIIRRGQPVLMEVVTLADIREGEEVCVPYLDPALPMQLREQIFEITYGFRCECSSCTFTRSLPSPIPSPPEEPKDLQSTYLSLRTFVFQPPPQQTNPESITFPPLPSPKRNLHQSFPPSLTCIFHESFLPSLSESFAESCHTNQHVPFKLGETLLALYLILYPRNYPQIGMHLLELAKTTWNAIAANRVPSPNDPQSYLRYATECLAAAAEILRAYGDEGDEGGPLSEVQTLQDLLAGELGDYTAAR